MGKQEAVAHPFAGVVLSYVPEGTSERYEVEASSLPAASLGHLLQAGFSKVIGGAASNTKTNVERQAGEEAFGKMPVGKGSEAAKADWAARVKDYIKEHAEEVAGRVARQATEDRAEQFQALKDGTISTRGPSDPLAPFVKMVLENAVRKHCAKTGQALPTGAAMTKAMQEVLSKHGEEKVRERAAALAGEAEL